MFVGEDLIGTCDFDLLNDCWSKETIDEDHKRNERNEKRSTFFKIYDCFLLVCWPRECLLNNMLERDIRCAIEVLDELVDEKVVNGKGEDDEDEEEEKARRREECVRKLEIMLNMSRVYCGGGDNDDLYFWWLKLLKMVAFKLNSLKYTKRVLGKYNKWSIQRLAANKGARWCSTLFSKIIAHFGWSKLKESFEEMIDPSRIENLSSVCYLINVRYYLFFFILNFIF